MSGFGLHYENENELGPTLSLVRPITRLRGLGHGLELIPREGCESLALLPLGSVTLPSLCRPPYGRVSERVILRNDTESESESTSMNSNGTEPTVPKSVSIVPKSDAGDRSISI